MDRLNSKGIQDVIDSTCRPVFLQNISKLSKICVSLVVLKPFCETLSELIKSMYVCSSILKSELLRQASAIAFIRNSKGLSKNCRNFFFVM